MGERFWIACFPLGRHPSRAKQNAPLVLGGGLWPIGPSENFDECRRLSVQFFREHEPTCSLAVGACVVSPSVMQHPALMGHDSWTRFNSRSYRSLRPRPSDPRVFGKLKLVHQAPTGMPVYAIDPSASGGGFHSQGCCRHHHPVRRSSTACCQLRSQRWLPGILWTLHGWHDAPARPTHVGGALRRLRVTGCSPRWSGGSRAGGHHRRRPRPTDERPDGRFAARPPSPQPSLRTT